MGFGGKVIDSLPASERQLGRWCDINSIVTFECAV
jgi:hypothetical protein